MEQQDPGKILTALAREAIAAELGQTSPAATDDHPLLHQQRGVFVTLKHRGELRGCIGSLTAAETVLQGVRRHACNAAFHDHRFPPLTAEELPQVSISVSVLSTPQDLAHTDPEDLCRRLVPEQDGVILRHPSGRSATFLPQVWHQLPRCADFLGALARKAGLAATGWQDEGVHISTYHADVYLEEGNSSSEC
ncbi:MAG: hypothetical protein BWK76_17615 [Desulfobulbaceae bacterium A2]|nr:MAG: hypothetical protein BWK76_17615 [Desulfobulbaceae bacterium A2]